MKNKRKMLLLASIAVVMSMDMTYASQQLSPAHSPAPKVSSRQLKQMSAHLSRAEELDKLVISTCEKTKEALDKLFDDAEKEFLKIGKDTKNVFAQAVYDASRGTRKTNYMTIVKFKSLLEKKVDEKYQRTEIEKAAVKLSLERLLDTKAEGGKAFHPVHSLFLASVCSVYKKYFGNKLHSDSRLLAFFKRKGRAEYAEEMLQGLEKVNKDVGDLLTSFIILEQESENVTHHLKKVLVKEIYSIFCGDYDAITKKAKIKGSNILFEDVLNTVLGEHSRAVRENFATKFLGILEESLPKKENYFLFKRYLDKLTGVATENETGSSMPLFVPLFKLPPASSDTSSISSESEERQGESSSLQDTTGSCITWEIIPNEVSDPDSSTPPSTPPSTPLFTPLFTPSKEENIPYRLGYIYIDEDDECYPPSERGTYRRCPGFSNGSLEPQQGTPETEELQEDTIK
ncbi:MAG: hypothetical protein LBT70_04895 [Holosporaceae bacterium]|jgi:hypothetical protein|nr:hypothetical protein [Holosporaceae bacterium]